MMFDLQGYEFLILKGARLTLMVGVFSLTVAIFIGLFGAWAKLSRSRLSRAVAEIYTTVFRGVPELVLILLIYYGFPTLVQTALASMGHEVILDFNPFVSGVFTLGLIYGAFTTEVFRGAFMAVPKGQIEVAKALGMSRKLIARRILLPQMLRFALPGIGNVWMVLIKATALISVIQLTELMRNAEVASRATRMPFTCFFLASLLYLGITALSVLVQKRLEKYANRGVRRA